MVQNRAHQRSCSGRAGLTWKKYYLVVDGNDRTDNMARNYFHTEEAHGFQQIYKG